MQLWVFFFLLARKYVKKKSSWIIWKFMLFPLKICSINKNAAVSVFFILLARKYMLNKKKHFNNIVTINSSLFFLLLFFKSSEDEPDPPKVKKTRRQSTRLKKKYDHNTPQAIEYQSTRILVGQTPSAIRRWDF